MGSQFEMNYEHHVMKIRNFWSIMNKLWLLKASYLLRIHIYNPKKMKKKKKPMAGYGSMQDQH